MARSAEYFQSVAGECSVTVVVQAVEGRCCTQSMFVCVLIDGADVKRDVKLESVVIAIRVARRGTDREIICG